MIIADFPVKWTVASLAHFYDDGIHCVTPSQRTIPATLMDPKIKNRSRMYLQVANMQVSLLNDPNAMALLIDPDGFVAEGTGANFFMVRDGCLLTPEPRNCLHGTRRTYILDLARRLSMPTRETNIELYDVASADEAFFTSTAFSMLPCTRINGLPIGDGKPGPVFARLMGVWSEEVGVDIIAQTKAFAAEVGALTSGSSTYRFAREKQ